MAVTHQGTGKLGPIEYLLLAREAGKVVVAKGVEDKTKIVGKLVSPQNSVGAVRFRFRFRLNVGKDGVITVDHHIRRSKDVENEFTFLAEVNFTRARGYGDWAPNGTNTLLLGHDIVTDKLTSLTPPTSKKPEDARGYALHVLQSPDFERLVLQHVEAWLQKAGA